MSAKKGFTLIELVVVLSILAIIGAMSAVSARVIQRRALQSASLMLQADLRRAQRMAVSDGRKYGVTLSAANNRYLVHTVPRRDSESEEVLLPHGVRISYYTHYVIEYLPRGSVSTGFSIDLVCGSYTQRITGVPGSGRVIVYDVDTVTYSHSLRGGGFSFETTNAASISELSPCVPRFHE